MLNKLLVSAMPLVPRLLVKAISKRYIAGEDTSSALKKCQELNTKGYLTTLDILGESIGNEEQAMKAHDAYIDLIEEVIASGIERNISLKPTALGLSLSRELAFRNIRSVISHAAKHDVFIRIDMEDSPYTQATLDIYEELRTIYPLVGTVIQAYLHRSLDDVSHVAQHQGNLRICKGIYKEPEAIAFQNKQRVREHFLELIRTMLTHKAYVGIATHDTYLIDAALDIIQENAVNPDAYEFQALLGVPIENRLQELREAGHRVRIYVPFGDQWYAYASRRLKENPDIAGYVVKDIFRGN